MNDLPLTMCECGHPAIEHFAHGRCGTNDGNHPAVCPCQNLVVRK